MLNKKLILLVLILLVWLAQPVGMILAQDVPGPLTPTLPPDDGEGWMPPYQFIIMAGMVIFTLLYTAFENRSNRKLHLEAVNLLYKSTPPLVRQPAYEFVAGTGDNVLKVLDDLAKSTDFTDLDDRAKERFATYWKEVKDRWLALKSGEIPPQETVQPGTLADRSHG